MSETFLALTAKTLPLFVRWHFLQHPKTILRQYAAYASALSSVFSFLYLLRTLFSPWKAIADVYPSKGFNLTEISSVFALNMTARGIGAVIRLCTIATGIVVELGLFAFFAAYLIAWVALPLFAFYCAFLLLASIA